MAFMLSIRAVFLPYTLTRSLPRALWIRNLTSDSNENGNSTKIRISALLEKLKSSSPDPDLSTLSSFMSLPPDQETPHAVDEVVRDQVASPDERKQPLSDQEPKADGQLPTKKLIEKTRGWKYNKVLREMRKDASREKLSLGDSKSGDLLGFLRQAVDESAQDDLKGMLEKSIEQTKSSKKKIFKTIESTQYRSSRSRTQWVEKTLEEVEKSQIDQAERSQKDVDPKLNQKIKSLLSDIEVAPKQMGTARTLVAAVENWGTNASYQRKTIRDEYEYQTNELPSSPSELLLQGERTGLFDSIVSKAKTAKINDTQSNFLHHLDELDKVDKIGYIGVRRNAFANQLSLSNRLWKYPIDNEVCKVEEENTSFEEHVFLEYLLDDFPSKGPVRRFMELVVNGLQKNPYLSVEQKKERVRWFHDYFSNFSEEELNF